MPRGTIWCLDTRAKRLRAPAKTAGRTSRFPEASHDALACGTPRLFSHVSSNQATIFPLPLLLLLACARLAGAGLGGEWRTLPGVAFEPHRFRALALSAAKIAVAALEAPYSFRCTEYRRLALPQHRGRRLRPAPLATSRLTVPGCHHPLILTRPAKMALLPYKPKYLDFSVSLRAIIAEFMAMTMFVFVGCSTAVFFSRIVESSFTTAEASGDAESTVCYIVGRWQACSSCYM